MILKTLAAAINVRILKINQRQVSVFKEKKKKVLIDIS